MTSKKLHLQILAPLIIFLVSLFAAIQPSKAICGGIVYVNQASPASNPFGCGWADAFPSLQSALVCRGEWR